ncbi:MAG: trypsin-like peptidase domain-containing protein [Candidatus Nealsonbacteria bacterium]|nr:trypsin-like peptidase domain-containing protein [Candidatus Nealsonbacteria bacterium]
MRTLNYGHVALVSAVALLVGLVGQAPCQELETGSRTWTDSTGKHTVVATFEKIEDGKVYLKKKDGESVDLPLARLSEADRLLAEKLQKQQSADKTPQADDNPFDKTPADTAPPKRQEVIDDVGKGIAYISTRNQFGREVGLGSGFVIDGSGLVATNYHVIAEAASASVKFRDGTEREVAGYRALDKKSDLAILQLEDPPADLRVLTLKKAEGLMAGDRVIAIGHPSGFKFTASSGMISAIRKTAEMRKEIQEFLKSDPDVQWLQIDAPISAGCSGGPVLNSYGDVIGIVAWVANGQNVGFAIHNQHLLELKSKLLDELHSLPVPGSSQGPSISESVVLEQLSKYREERDECFRKAASLADRKKALEILASENPNPPHLAKFRKLAEENPDTKVEFQALVTIVRLEQQHAEIIKLAGGEPDVSQENLKWALSRLLEKYGAAESMGGLALELCRLPATEVHEFVRGLIEKSPDNQVKGLSCVALAMALSAHPITRGRCEEEIIKTLERAAAEFGDIQIGDQPLCDLAGPMLKMRKDLAIGRTAPNITGKDSKGEEFQLSDYQGKVVLLDFWVDWCPYCRQMYPHERSLLEKYADKPFAIVGVNCEKLSRQQSVESSKAVTWRSWADGLQGPIAKEWQIAGYPTLYLIDHRGKIRMKGNIKGKILSAAVEALVAEAEVGLPENLVEPCSAWAYLDDGTEPEATWRDPDFDDSAWKSGRATLGYGDDDETTLLEFGPNPKSKHITAYFRRTFQADDPSKVKDLVLGLICDDGAAVYLNGQEVARENLEKDAKHADTAIQNAKDDGHTRHYFNVDPKFLQKGANVLAVEVHQINKSSSDLRFDLTLGSGVKVDGAK